MEEFDFPQKEVTTLEEVQSYVANELGVLVYFYNDSCAPCVSLRPKIVEMMSQSFPKMKLIFVNSSFRDIPAHYQVYSNPTLLVFFDRKEYLRESKYVSIPKLESDINRFYEMVYSD